MLYTLSLQSKSPAAPPVEEEGEDEGEDTDEKNKKYLQSLTTQEVSGHWSDVTFGGHFPSLANRSVSCWRLWTWVSIKIPSLRSVSPGRSCWNVITTSYSVIWVWFHDYTESGL